MFFGERLCERLSVMKAQDLRQLEGRRENLHQQVRERIWTLKLYVVATMG
jgi:hypothetical protein